MFIYYLKVGGDVLYMCGVNFVGVFYRLMNEVVSRRSFLDRRAFLESNLRLQHEKEQEVRDFYLFFFVLKYVN